MRTGNRKPSVRRGHAEVENAACRESASGEHCVSELEKAWIQGEDDVIRFAHGV
jgi:hypothetical protein